MTLILLLYEHLNPNVINPIHVTRGQRLDMLIFVREKIKKAGSLSGYSALQVLKCAACSLTNMLIIQRESGATLSRCVLDFVSSPANKKHIHHK